MGVKKPLKSRKDSAGASSDPVGNRRHRKKPSKPRRKKVILKSSARDRIVQVLQPEGQKKKKILHLKKKCTIGKRLLSGHLKSLPSSSEKKIDEWLDNLNHKNGKSTDDQTLTDSSADFCRKTIHPAEQKDNLTLDSDMASTVLLGSSSSFSSLGKPENSSSNLDVTSTLGESHNETGGRAPSQMLSCINETELSHPGEVKQSKTKVKFEPGLSYNETGGKAPSQMLSCINETEPSHPGEVKQSKTKVKFEPGLSSIEEHVTSERKQPKDLSSKQDPNPISKIKGVIKRPLTVAKRIKSKRMYRRKEFLKFYLQNSFTGFHQALKKFHDKKLAHSSKLKRAIGAESAHLEAVNSHKKVPLRVVVKGRLSSSDVAQSLGSSLNDTDAATPIEQKIISRLNLHPHDPKSQNVVSCEVPFESSFEGCSPEEEKMQDRNIGSQASKRDVCYIFALLDKEKEEAMFKCSPHVKTSRVLQQLANVIDSISTDDDLMLSKKIHPTEDFRDECSERARVTDRSTSPIAFPVKPIQEDSSFAEPLNPFHLPAEDVRNMNEEENSDDSGMQSDMERKGMIVNATTKVIISKALLSFTSELKVFTDVSIRLLGWCSGSIKADLDSDSFEDEFEGFLCHCHDKVSILIECLDELDSRQILNVDKAELCRFWLLHDALRCMLQAYRYTQSPSASRHLSQKLLSLILTCSKTILPSVSTSLDKWVSLMTMISGISTKLCEARLLSNVCLCYQHFESLRRGRSCRVCDLKSFYEEVCNTEPSNPKFLNGKTSTLHASKTAVQQLFPRFCWFLNEVEGLSKEEFMTAFQKHSIVKFSCNIQSGLYPCAHHLSNIACSCFATSADVEPVNVGQTDGKTVFKAKAAEGNNDKYKHTALNESSDQQIVPLCVEVVEDDIQKCSEENSCAGDGHNIVSGATSEVLTANEAVEIPVESVDSSTASEITVDLRNNQSNCKQAVLNTGSSDDFSFELEETYSDSVLQSRNTKELDHQRTEDGTAATDVEGLSCSMGPLPHLSQSCDTIVPNSPDRHPSVESLFSSDITLSLSSSEIDCSEVAEANFKRNVLDNDLGSISSVRNFQNTLPGTYPDEEDLMRDVSIGEDDVFESGSSVVLNEHSSMCTHMGSDSPTSMDMDEAHSSQEIEETRQHVLKSPPLYNLKKTPECLDSSEEDNHSQTFLNKGPPPVNDETTLEDAESSVEVAALNGNLVGCGLPSTQDKDDEVENSASWTNINRSCVSTHATETEQTESLKEDYRQRLRQALRSKLAGASVPTEANCSNQRSTRSSKQNSTCEGSDKKSVSKEIWGTSDANPSQLRRVSNAVLSLEESKDQQEGPKEGRNVKCVKPRIKASDKRVTFNDILQFKEFRDEPILGYGRCTRQMPENFVNNLKQKINCLINEVYCESDNMQTLKGDLDEKGLSIKSSSVTNVKENREDIGNVASTCEEGGLQKSKKGKLSLKSSKANPLKEVKKKEKPTNRMDSSTNVAYDKLRQFSMLDDKFRKTFDPQRTGDIDTESSLGPRKSKSRLKRTITNVGEDASDKSNEESVNSQNAKKTLLSELKVLDDAVQQNILTSETSKIIKSCLKKTTYSGHQTETNNLENSKLVPCNNKMFRRAKPENKDEPKVKEVGIMTQSKPTMEQELDRISEQNACFKRARRASRRMLKETVERNVGEQVTSTTMQDLRSDEDNSSNPIPKRKVLRKVKKVELPTECAKETTSKKRKTIDFKEIESYATMQDFRSDDDNCANPIPKRKVSKKGKKVELPTECAKETTSKIRKTNDFREIESDAKKSKKSKSQTVKGVSGSRKSGPESTEVPSLNVSNASDPEWKTYLTDLKVRFLKN